MDMQDIANEVMKFIQNEVDRLSKGKWSSRDEGGARPPPPDFSDFFTRWNERARRQRSSYHNFRRHNPRFTGFTTHSNRTYSAPNPRLAKMWMHQSKEDLRSIKHLCLPEIHCTTLCASSVIKLRRNLSKQLFTLYQEWQTGSCTPTIWFYWHMISHSFLELQM